MPSLFCRRCGAELQETEKTSEVNLSKSRNNNRRRIVLSFVSVGLIGCIAFATTQIQSISSSIENFFNPVPEKVFIQVAKPVTNQGWLQSTTLEVQLESTKPNSYQAVLEIKKGGKWENFRNMNVTFNQDDMVARKLSVFSSTLKPGTSEFRVKVMRDQGNQELVEISESVKVRILKMPVDMQIANDSNNTIVWRFAKENEKPQYCSKYKECYFLKIASTKKCTIKATLKLNKKVVNINSVSKNSVGSVAAYTPKKPYLIEVPYNSSNTGDISARCFALKSQSNQQNKPTPTPTKEPQILPKKSDQECENLRYRLDQEKRKLQALRPSDWPGWREFKVETAVDYLLLRGDLDEAEKAASIISWMSLLRQHINSRC
jgi:hypothetical protein